MRPKLVVILLLIVVVPLGALGWLGYRVARDEQERVQQRFRSLLLGRLRDVDAAIAKLLRQLERELLAGTDLPAYDSHAIRVLVRKERLIHQAFVLAADGKLIHPPLEGDLSDAERQFLIRTQRIWTDRSLFGSRSERDEASRPRGLPQQTVPMQREARQYRGASQKSRPIVAHGWHPWFWEHGINLVFWRRLSDGSVIGVEVERVRLLSDIVGELPDTDPMEPSVARGRIALLDSRGTAVYQWGAHTPASDERPAAELSLSHPLMSWKLAYFVPGAEMKNAFGSAALFNFLAGLLAVGVALIGLAVYFYRESAREMREAAQRVSFVSRVSHELKTPLTNIRMYAELLESQLADATEKSHRHLGVIVSETGRLSRLINNVLAFARKQRKTLKVRMSDGVIDEHVAGVLESFKPSLESRGVDVRFHGNAGSSVRFDPDALEQILGNLFSNVEKYAPQSTMTVATEQEDDTTVITVSDEGPGIPESQRDRIFNPFHRVSDRLTERASGTGIGLTIARDLARVHGGDVTLVTSEKGACFRVVLRTPQAHSGGSA